MKKQEQLSLDEQSYLKKLDNHDLNLEYFKFNSQHVFKHDTKEAKFFHFKNLLTLKTLTEKSSIFPHYHYEELKIPATLKNKLLMQTAHFLVKDYTEKERIISTKLGNLDFNFSFYSSKQKKLDTNLALALALEDYTINDFNALMYCTKIGYLEGVQYFLEQGALIDYLGVIDKKPHNALSLAIEYQQTHIAHYLIDNGANLHFPINHDYQTEDLLDLAIKYQNFEIAQKLIDLGFDVNWVNYDTTTDYSMKETRLMKIGALPFDETQKTINFYLKNNFNLFSHYNCLDQHLLMVGCKCDNLPLISLALEYGNPTNHTSSVTSVQSINYLNYDNGKVFNISQILKKNNIAFNMDNLNTDEGIFQELAKIRILNEQEKFHAIIEKGNPISSSKKRIKI